VEALGLLAHVGRAVKDESTSLHAEAERALGAPGPDEDDVLVLRDVRVEAAERLSIVVGVFRSGDPELGGQLFLC
jgi:hypothetical protein